MKFCVSSADNLDVPVDPIHQMPLLHNREFREHED